MLTYIAVLASESDALKSVSACFCTSQATIKEFDGKWVLASAEFDKCRTGQDVFPIADRILANVKKLVNLYSGLKLEVKVDRVLWLNNEGNPYNWSIRSSIEVNVYSQAGLQTLGQLTATSPLGSAVLAEAQSNDALSQLLVLLPEGEFTWSQIYDLIEFLGGAEGIGRAGIGSRAGVRRIRQAANHYRHLGANSNSPLPPKPPTISEARSFVRDLLLKWIESRI